MPISAFIASQYRATKTAFSDYLVGVADSYIWDKKEGEADPQGKGEDISATGSQPLFHLSAEAAWSFAFWSKLSQNCKEQCPSD